MQIVPGKRPNEQPREQSSMPCWMLREQPPMTNPRAIKAVGPGSDKQPRKEPREPNASVKGVLKLNMSNDAQEKHCLQGRVNAPPKQPKAQVCKGHEMCAAAKEQKNCKWRDMRAAAKEQKNRKWRDM
eukprot:11945726-Ditylum_brightwellii.AAC.1